MASSIVGWGFLSPPPFYLCLLPNMGWEKGPGCNVGRVHSLIAVDRAIKLIVFMPSRNNKKQWIFTFLVCVVYWSPIDFKKRYAAAVMMMARMQLSRLCLLG